MTRRVVILIGVLFVAISVKARSDRYFSDNWFSIYEGSRNVFSNQVNTGNQIDFLNYMYSVENDADYPYIEFATRLKHYDLYQIDVRLTLYNSVVPYCYNISYERFLNENFGIMAGSLANRYYITEFNDIYSSIFDVDINARSLVRQWNMSLIGAYIGPSYQNSYEIFSVYAVLKAGMATFYPFQQKNIIKEEQTNYKMVYDYNSRVNFQPFIMPEVEFSVEFIQYRRANIGGRIRMAYMYTRTSINYNQDFYEWTYDSPVHDVVKTPKHNFQQLDWDLGVFIRW